MTLLPDLPVLRAATSPTTVDPVDCAALGFEFQMPGLPEISWGERSGGIYRRAVAPVNLAQCRFHGQTLAREPNFWITKVLARQPSASSDQPNSNKASCRLLSAAYCRALCRTRSWQTNSQVTAACCLPYGSCCSMRWVKGCLTAGLALNGGCRCVMRFRNEPQAQSSSRDVQVLRILLLSTESPCRCMTEGKGWPFILTRMRP